MFELRRLRLLHELSLRGTLAAVAEALSYSPSTVSQQLTQLEKEAGVPLFAADGRGVRLTDHGELLAAHAARALQLDEQARGELDALRPQSAPVRIAVMQSAAQSLVPPALALLAAREPDLAVYVSQVPPEEGLFELSTRRYDLVVAEQYPGHTREQRPGLIRVSLGRDPIRLAVPRGGRRSHLEQLADRAWVMEPVGTAARQWATQQCRAAGFEPDVRFEIADLTAHVGLIADGVAVGMLPELVRMPTPGAVELHDLPGAPSREIFVAMRESSTRPAILAVRDALRDAFSRRHA